MVDSLSITRRAVCRASVLVIALVSFQAESVVLADSKEDGFEYDVRVVSKGTSSPFKLKGAKKEIPLARLDARQRQKADAVLSRVSHFRRLPTVEFPVEPDVYRYFLKHPDVAVGLWRVMGISQFQMYQTGPRQFEADAGDGSFGVTEVLYESPEECVVVCDGVYKTGLLRPIEAHGLLYLKTQFEKRDGGPVARHEAIMFMSFPSRAIKTAAKVISPLTNRIIDRNFEEISVFLQMMSMSMERHPGWTQRAAARLRGVHEARRTELVQLANHIYAKNQQPRIAIPAAGRSDEQPAVIRIDSRAPLRVATPATQTQRR